MSASPRPSLIVPLVWIALLVVIPATLVAVFVVCAPAMIAALIPRIAAGLVAYVWMLEAIVLATRPHWLDRLIGLPKMYMMHGVLGVLALVFAFLHQLDLPSAGLTRLTGQVAFYMLLALVVVALVTMAGWISERFAPAKALRRAIERVGRHEVNVWLHRLLIVATAIVIAHFNLVWYFTMMPAFVATANAYAAVVAAVYVWAKFRDRVLAPQGRVVNIHCISGDVWSLEVRVSALADSWEEGDFVFLRFPGVKGMGEYHPFSIMNRPNAVGLMTFAIRADGDFTRLLGTSISKGMRVAMLRPFGRYRRFLEERGSGRPVVIYAGGIGVTPLIPVAQYCTEHGREVTMLYSARTLDDLIGQNELTAWAAESANTLRLLVGQFSEQELADAIRPDALYLIGGPSPMLRAITTMLRRNGVRPADIFSEPFAW
ncbi:ferredoxin reductase domain-containing protein [Bifidobacterium eulemuris]|uniref:Ferric reductase n=1 Tax=Bifidobacterium eulemuris TaxID=1765219 RepID=A0A261G971_9BIFI|nr:hypothetical protein [Bifidobacterium eulemuris]OZG67546.1 ferric reductase [Bifidobacterium eulemuris]QOL31082.1 ferric reductase [Bifidobacterium eulemuris]